MVGLGWLSTLQMLGPLAKPSDELRWSLFYKSSLCTARISYGLAASLFSTWLTFHTFWPVLLVLVCRA